MADIHQMFPQRINESDGVDGGGGSSDDGDMDARLTALEARFDAILPTLATRVDMADVKTEIQKSAGETHKWMIATVIGLFLGFGGLFLAMSNALKPEHKNGGAPQQAQPIIITVPQVAPPPSSAESRKK